MKYLYLRQSILTSKYITRHTIQVESRVYFKTYIQGYFCSLAYEILESALGLWVGWDRGIGTWTWLDNYLFLVLRKHPSLK